MANFTKKAIEASFIKLLTERPLSQITVKDIVTDCGINRNTFYYYFESIPKLIETVVEEDAANVHGHLKILAGIDESVGGVDETEGQLVLATLVVEVVDDDRLGNNV